MKGIFLNEDCCAFIQIELKYICKDPVSNKPALVQIMTWCLTGNKPLSQQMMAKLLMHTVYPKKYAHGFCFAVLCCGYTLTDFPISIRLTSLALWQSNDCPSASKATLMNMDKYLMWIHYERLHNHNKAKHNKTVCIFLEIYCICIPQPRWVKTFLCRAWTVVSKLSQYCDYWCPCCSHLILGSHEVSKPWDW